MTPEGSKSKNVLNLLSTTTVRPLIIGRQNRRARRARKSWSPRRPAYPARNEMAAVANPMSSSRICAPTFAQLVTHWDGRRGRGPVGSVEFTVEPLLEAVGGLRQGLAVAGGAEAESQVEAERGFVAI